MHLFLLVLFQLVLLWDSYWLLSASGRICLWTREALWALLWEIEGTHIGLTKLATGENFIWYFASVSYFSCHPGINQRSSGEYVSVAQVPRSTYYGSF